MKTTYFCSFQSAVTAALLLLLLPTCYAQHQAEAVESRGSGGVNALHQQHKPYLILVSIDGFRWDYMDRYPTPNMDKIAATGSKAERLLPIFPTLTFPNHYSIATGMYPANHGLVANDFPDPARDKWYSLKDRESVEDPDFYAGEPIWVTAETQGMVSASFFFVGTEAPIEGVLPTHWRSYDQTISGEDRVDQVLTWLAEPEQNRPHLLTLYFEDVDDHSHSHGPGSTENIEAIKRVDDYIGRLLDGLDRLPHRQRINIMLVSDHGQGSYLDNPQAFILDELVELQGARIIEGGSYLFLHLEQDDASRAADIVETVNRHWKYGKAYLPTDSPEQWKLDSNPRFPHVILMPDAGFAVLSSADKAAKINAGDHGWPPENPAMHGFFVAGGPNIKKGLALGPVNNIDIYPLICAILGLEPSALIDGNAAHLEGLLVRD